MYRWDCNGTRRAGAGSWSLYYRRLATTPLQVLAGWTPASKEFTAFDAHRRLVPYNASNQASPARPRRLRGPATGSEAPEASRRHAARARPRLVLNNALSQLEPCKAPRRHRRARGQPVRRRLVGSVRPPASATKKRRRRAARHCLCSNTRKRLCARRPRNNASRKVNDVLGRHGHALPRPDRK